MTELTALTSQEEFEKKPSNGISKEQNSLQTIEVFYVWFRRSDKSGEKERKKKNTQKG